jgi:signal transduction histidine kinase
MQQTLTLEAHAADQLVRESHELSRSWAKCVARELSPAQLQAMTFQVAGQMPEILRGIADFVRDDERYAITDDEAVVTALVTLARMRRSEGSSPAEVIGELDVLARLLDGACLEWLRSYPATPEPAAVVRVTGRLNRAPILMGQIMMQALWEDGQQGDGERHVAREVQEFADMLAHELNTPLNAASMTAQLLEYADTGTQEARRLALLIRRQLERVNAVMRDVRAASLGGSGQTATLMMPFGQVLADILTEIRDEARTADVRLDLDEPIPAVRMNASRLKIVLVNLIRNAIKYANPARPVRWVRIGFRREARDGVWWVEVSDNGMGIPAEHHASVFRESFRAHPERANGTGRGLLIVRQEVEQLGGRIEFSSEPGVGTTFRFCLPEAGAPE